MTLELVGTEHIRARQRVERSGWVGVTERMGGSLPAVGVSLLLPSPGQPSFCVRCVPEANHLRLHFILHILFHISGNSPPILSQ